MKRLIGAVALVAAASLPASAQELAPAEESAVLVSELVVKPATPGPAWWRISDDDSAVYVMIVPGVSITGLKWDRSVVERRMAGANRFILPHDLSLADPRSIAGMAGLMVQTPKLLFAPKPKKVKKDPNIAPLEERLPPAVRDKFVAARKAIGQPAERYATLHPWEAASAIERDYRASLKLTTSDEFFGGVLVREIETLAKRNKVKVVSAWKIVIPPMKLNVVKNEAPPLDKAYACLDKALDQMVARGEAQRRAALAWSEGDVRPILKPDRFVREESCNGPMMGMETHDKKLIDKTEESFVSSQAAALEAALKIPGRSVAVLDALSPLGNLELGMLGKRGVLERLRAKGYTITAPDVLND